MFGQGQGLLLKAKAKDLTLKAKAKAKDLTFKAKAKANAKDSKFVLEDSSRPRTKKNNCSDLHKSELYHTESEVITVSKVLYSNILV